MVMAHIQGEAPIVKATGLAKCISSGPTHARSGLGEDTDL
jgi:hypothetical protein